MNWERKYVQEREKYLKLLNQGTEAYKVMMKALSKLNIPEVEEYNRINREADNTYRRMKHAQNKKNKKWEGYPDA